MGPMGVFENLKQSTTMVLIQAVQLKCPYLLGAAPLVLLSSAQLNEKFLSDALASLGTDVSLRSGQIPSLQGTAASICLKF